MINANISEDTPMGAKLTNKLGTRTNSDVETDTIKAEVNEEKSDASLLSRILVLAYRLDKCGIESRGIERVSPQERQNNSTLKQFLDVLGLWFAGCGGLTTMSSFFLATLVFTLNLRQLLAAGLVAMNLGCLVPAYCATMGPTSGCRQMVTARFLFGIWGVKVIAIICIIGGIGWSVVNCVLGGQVLLAIGTVPLFVGIIVIFFGSFVVGIFGIHFLLRFESIIAIPTNVTILLYYVVTCKKMDYITVTTDLLRELNMTGKTQTGLFLSFFTIAYSVTATWGSCASDYYILFPERTSQYHIFWVTFLGIAIPSNFAAVVGTLAGNIAYSYPPWMEAYNSMGIGGIIAAAFEPWGAFGKFVVVVMYLLLLCNTVINTYSSALQFQLVDLRLAMVPRCFWAAFISVVYLILSLLGKSHLSAILGNVLPMLGYWISLYIVLLLEENLLFRTKLTRHLHPREFEKDGEEESSQDRKSEDEKAEQENEYSSFDSPYQWCNWNQPKKITAGWACAVSFLVGVAGAVLGMNQVYFIGPLARKIGDSGGDIGMWLCMGFCGTVYPILRTIELKKLGK